MKWVTSPTRTKEFTPTAGACFRKDGPAALAKHQESSLRSNDHRTRDRQIAIPSDWHLEFQCPSMSQHLPSMSQHVPVVCLSTLVFGVKTVHHCECCRPAKGMEFLFASPRFARPEKVLPSRKKELFYVLTILIDPELCRVHEIHWNSGCDQTMMILPASLLGMSESKSTRALRKQ